MHVLQNRNIRNIVNEYETWESDGKIF